MIAARAERFMAMGTRVELHVFGPCDPEALLAARRAIERVDDALTIHRPSPAVSLNEALAAGRPAVVDDPVLLAALAETRELIALTGGLFDPAAHVGAGGREWTLDPARRAVSADGQMAFDFGGFGKGFALDRAGAVLRAGGVQSALLSAGESSILVIGRHPLGARWPLGVPDPCAPGCFLVELELEDEALSVSSTLAAGVPGRQPTVRPQDGTPVCAPATAVAIDPRGARAEALSTALLAATPAERGRLGQGDPGRRLCFRHGDGDAIAPTIDGACP